jgi:thiosulfate/3-mercaptopyruvate sulfurtransferase
MRGPAALALGLALSVPAAEASDFFYVGDATPLLNAGATVVDSRPLALCRKRSLEGARCLPADDFLGPHRRLPALFDVRWALGTAGLTGGETVLVAGDEPTARDFVAGLLYLAGQREVAILRAPIGRDSGGPSGVRAPGTARGMTREKVFQAPARDELWLLRGELAARTPDAPNVVLVDGRSEDEFWGRTTRAARGGHLPGAESVPAAAARAALARNEPVGPRGGEPIAYAHDPFEGIAFFTLLRAGAGIAAKVFPGGWAEWAAGGGLPADAATYPDRAPQASAAKPLAGASPWTPFFAGVALASIVAGAGGYFLGRRIGSGRNA